MKDVVKMTVFLAGDPAKGGKLDFAGFAGGAISHSLGLRVSRTNLPEARCRLPLWPRVGAARVEVIAVRSK